MLVLFFSCTTFLAATSTLSGLCCFFYFCLSRFLYALLKFACCCVASEGCVELSKADTSFDSSGSFGGEVVTLLGDGGWNSEKLPRLGDGSVSCGKN